jgi:predicted component of type VI protein secretion system
MRILLKGPPAWDSVGDVLVERFPFVIGRGGKLDCTLPLVFISRSHCKLSLHDGEVQVEDLGSSNGTFVNGRKISGPTPLRHDDVLSFGPLQFRVMRQGIPAGVKQQAAAGAHSDASTLMVPPSPNPAVPAPGSAPSQIPPV